MTEPRMKHFGWGREGEAMTAEEEGFVLDRYRQRFGVDRFDEKAPPKLQELDLPAARIAPPRSLASLCSNDRYERARHTYGKSYPDYVRAMLGRFASAPDVVAYPRNEAEVADVIAYQQRRQAARKAALAELTALAEEAGDYA